MSAVDDPWANHPHRDCIELPDGFDTGDFLTTAREILDTPRPTSIATERSIRIEERARKLASVVVRLIGSERLRLEMEANGLLAPAKARPHPPAIKPRKKGGR